MDQVLYATAAVLKDIIQFIPTSVSGDTVTIKITRLSDSKTWHFTNLAFETGANTGSMTFVSDQIWKASFTPDQKDTYVVYINNSTKSVDYQQTIIVAAGPIIIPSGSWGASITVGTNSFVTAVEAETYFATRFGASEHWDALTDAQKVSAIITSYYQITTLYTLATSVVVKRAQLEQSLFLVVHGSDMLRRKGLQAQGVTSSGMVKETYNKEMALDLPVSDVVSAMLQGSEKTNNFYADDLTRNDDEDVN